MKQGSTAAATIVAKRHLALARVIARSFRSHHPDIPFFVLLADEVSGCFDPSSEPFEFLSIDDLGRDGVLPLCFRYAQAPLSYALTPQLLEHLLDRGFEQVIFIKQESLVLDRLTSVLDALPGCSIALTPHLLSPLRGEQCERRELDILQAGTFNGGVIGVRATSITRSALSWWRSRLAFHCVHDVARGMHFEQRWLDLLHTLFGDVQVIRDPGCNVGHWHLPERAIRIENGTVYADGAPCQLFRFSGFETDTPAKATRYFDRLTVSEMGDAGLVFTRYRDLLLRAGHAECGRWPFAWDCFDNGITIPAIARDLYRELGPDASAFGNPFSSHEERSFLSWLTAPVQSCAPGVSRLWHALYQRRTDVRAAYPDALGRDREGLIGWINNTGWRECGIDARLRPSEGG